MGGEGLGREDDGRGWEVMGGSYYLSLSLSYSAGFLQARVWGKL